MIPVLVPRDLTPSGSSRTGHTLRQLDRIGQFQVISSPTSHPDPYTVHIRLVRPPNRQATSTGQPLLTPILAAKRDETSKNASELSVTRDFAAFTELRRNILALTRQYHPQHCALCTRLGLLLLSSFSQPTLPLKTFLRSSNQRAKHLQLFLQDAVVIMSVHRSRCAHTCAAHRVLPILLHDFFFEPSRRRGARQNNLFVWICGFVSHVTFVTFCTWFSSNWKISYLYNIIYFLSLEYPLT